MILSQRCIFLLIKFITFVTFHILKNVKENTDGLPPQFRESVAQGMEYLKEVGTQIQQALANFGIIFVIISTFRSDYIVRKSTVVS